MAITLSMVGRAGAGVKVAARFDGTLSSPTVLSGGINVSSIVKNGTGDYTLNFTTPILANAVYAGMLGSAGFITFTSPTTTSVRIKTYGTGGAATNFDNISVIGVNA